MHAHDKISTNYCTCVHKSSKCIQCTQTCTQTDIQHTEEALLDTDRQFAYVNNNRMLPTTAK